MRKKEDLPNCPVTTTVSMIGNKWKLLIIRNLISRPWRFNELQRDLEGISQKVLTDSLRSMEADGIITRTVYPEVPPRVEYALSELGKSLCPVIDEMKKWGYGECLHYFPIQNLEKISLTRSSPTSSPIILPSDA